VRRDVRARPPRLQPVAGAGVRLCVVRRHGGRGAVERLCLQVPGAGKRGWEGEGEGREGVAASTADSPNPRAPRVFSLTHHLSLSHTKPPSQAGFWHMGTIIACVSLACLVIYWPAWGGVFIRPTPYAVRFSFLVCV
jgi:hypothetical protein